MGFNWTELNKERVRRLALMKEERLETSPDMRPEKCMVSGMTIVV
nr:hypothetical protein [Bacillus sp. J37]